VAGKRTWRELVEKMEGGERKRTKIDQRQGSTWKRFYEEDQRGHQPMKYKLRNETSKYRRGTLSFLGRGAKISVDEKTKLKEKQGSA
jgi:hypothetical protein